MVVSVAPLVSSKDQKAHFWEAYSRAFVREVVRTIIDDYASAAKFAIERYGEHYKGRVAPSHVRRDDIECHFLDLTVRFQDDVVIGDCSNRTGTSKHVEILSKIRPAVMTVSKTTSARAPVRRARHRETLASDPRVAFADPAFAHLHRPPLPEGTPLYVAIIHGAVIAQSKRPDFVHAVFPWPNGYYLPGVDLLAEYNDLLAAPASSATEHINEHGGQPLLKQGIIGEGQVRLKSLPRKDQEEDKA